MQHETSHSGGIHVSHDTYSPPHRKQAYRQMETHTSLWVFLIITLSVQGMVPKKNFIMQQMHNDSCLHFEHCRTSFSVFVKDCTHQDFAKQCHFLGDASCTLFHM